MHHPMENLHPSLQMRLDPLLTDRLVYVTLNDQLTLFARSTAGIGEPFGRQALLSKSLFHFSTASYVVARVTSNTTNAATASL